MKIFLSSGTSSPPDKTKQEKLTTAPRQQFYDHLNPLPSQTPVGSMFSMSMTQFHSQILEQAENAVIIIDENNNIVFFNHNAERLWGRNRNTVQGANIS
ncbi:MAG: PAS domain S-box protein, partial [Azoarcus sp.]|nr:PAS domain S-box protein [Azoarcus sp.]